MPFAFVGLFLALFINQVSFQFETLIWVVLCMVTARNAAMAFNRWLDRDIDKANPRTASREIPGGIIKPKQALLFVIINSILFVLISYLINPICFYLSPLALLIVLGYSYTKRFTYLCHIILGLGLSLAPVGAYLAVQAEFHLYPVLYGIAVLCWVAGFDMIYALQDDNFDNENNLHSIPARFGRKNSLTISSVLHVIAFLIIVYVWWDLKSNYEGIGMIHLIGVIIFSALLFYQHTLVKLNDLSRINLAFFTTNGVASILFACFVILDFYF